MRRKIDKDDGRFLLFVVFFLIVLGIAGAMEIKDEARCYMAETEQSDEQVKICRER